MSSLSDFFNKDMAGPFATGLVVGVSCCIVYYKLFKRLPPGASSSSFDRISRLTKLTARAQNLANGVGKHGRSHKMVFVVRQDLGMGKGKIAAQCSHAAITCYQRAQEIAQDDLDMWETTGTTKVCLKFDGDESGLKALEIKAKERGIVTGLICDAGHTQVPSGSYTVLGLGPAPMELIDEITGHLKLL